MPRPLDIALAEHAIVAEGGLRLASRRLERLVELWGLPDDAHPSPATARRGLDDEWKADLVRLTGWNDRDARLARDALGLELVTTRPQSFRGRPDPRQSRGVYGFGEVRVLGEEAVARMNRVRGRLLRRTDVLLREEVAHDLYGLVSRTCVARALVDL